MPFDRQPYPPYSPPPIPVDGIKARSQRGRIGEHWWSQRFIAVLESFDMGARLARGRRYARLGQVVTMTIARGRVDATVQGSRPKPYKVSISVATLPEPDWARVVAAMASRAVFLARLLGGEMPDEIEEAFVESSVSLFPTRSSHLRTTCSCPDSANPCKHIAAVLFLMAEEFDDDPFLILAWRGMERDDLLARLRALRSRGSGSSIAGTPASQGGTKPEDGDDPRSERPAFDLGWPVTASGPADIEAMQLRPAPAFWRQGTVEAPSPVSAVTVPDALLRLLDPLDVTIGERSVTDLLRGAYEVLGETPDG